MTTWWLNDDYLMTIWWLSDDYLMCIWWLSDLYLRTIWWLTNDCLMNPDDYLMAGWWLSDDPRWLANDHWWLYNDHRWLSYRNLNQQISNSERGNSNPVESWRVDLGSRAATAAATAHWCVLTISFLKVWQALVVNSRGSYQIKM